MHDEHRLGFTDMLVNVMTKPVRLHSFFFLTYESSRVESSFPLLEWFFGLSLYWHPQTVLQRSISLEITFRAILNHNWVHYRNILRSLRVKSGDPERVRIFCPTCGIRRDLLKITGNQSHVTVGEQTPLHHI